MMETATQSNETAATADVPHQEGTAETGENAAANEPLVPIAMEPIHTKPKKIKPAQAFVCDRPKWKLSLKVEEDHAPRPRRRLNSTLLAGQWKGLTEAEKRAWMTESDATDIKLAKLLVYHLREKIDYLENPRFCRVPKVFKALKLFHVQEYPGRLTEYIPLDPPTIVFDSFELGRVYTAAFQLLNSSDWSQRLRVLLPSSKTFQVHADDIQGKILAPGTYCGFTVTFTPTSISENEDAIFISSEMDSCQIRLVGSNPLPTIFVPSVVNLGRCLIRHSVAIAFPVASLEAAGKFSLESDVELSERSSYFDSLYGCENILYRPPFLVHPRNFKLYINESSDITVMFRPLTAGNFSHMVQIVTDSGQRWNVLMEGFGIELNLGVEQIDGRPVKPKELESGLWFGNATVSSRNVKRELTVNNSTLVSVRFYWKLESTDDGSPESPAFSAQPCFGVLEPQSEASFVFTFFPAEIKAYKQRAVLYLDTRQAFTLSTESWQQFRTSIASADKLAADVICSGYGESGETSGALKAAASVCDQIFQSRDVDNNGCIMKALEFDMIGVGDPFEVEIVPPLLVFSDLLVQGKVYTRSLELRNNTLSEVNYSWGTSNIPWVTAKDLNNVSVLPVTGKIGALGNATVHVTVRATKVGLLQETLFCTFDGPGGLTLPVVVEACVQGPRVVFLRPMLDFGLVEAGQMVSLETTLRNKSRVDASYKLFSVSDGPSGDSEDSSDQLEFTPASGTLSAKESVSITVSMVSDKCGEKAFAMVCQVADGLSPSQYSLARAFVDVPRAYFAPCKFDLGITFLYKRLSRSTVLHNLTGLTSYFRWAVDDDENVGDTSAVNIDITPREGELSPYGSKEIQFRLNPVKAGEKELISVCEIIGMEKPIGVLFRTYISDFRCSFHVLRSTEVVEADSFDSKEQLSFTEKLEPYATIKDLSTSLIDTTNLPTLNFGRKCTLGCVQWLRLILQNHTDISSKIHVAFGKYGTAFPPPLSKEECVVLSTLTGRPLVFSQDDMKSVLKTKKRKIPPLIDLPDEVHQKYWSDAGQFMVSRRLEIAMHDALVRSGEGISLLVYPNCEGFVDSWGQWYCDIFCFSCLPGSYTDVLVCSVGGLAPAEIPVTVGIVGTPLYARPQHLEPRGFQHSMVNTSLSIKWGPVAVGNPARCRKFWVSNVSPYPMELKWEMKQPIEDSNGHLSMVNLIPEDDSSVRVKLIGDPEKGPVKIRFDVEDKERVLFKIKENFAGSKDEHHPFTVTPMKQVVPTHGSVCFEASFSSMKACHFTFILIGRTKIIPSQEEMDFRDSNRLSRRVTFTESTEIILTDSVRRRSSVVAFSEHDKKSPEPLNEIIRITSAVGSLKEPGRRKSDGIFQETKRNSRSSILQDNRSPERRSSLKKRGSLLLPGQNLVRDAPQERRSSLRRSSFDMSIQSVGNSEPAATEDVGSDPFEDAILPVRVCLEASVFEPRLKPCCDEPLDYFCNGASPLSDKSYTKVLVLKNEYVHTVTFSASISPPFYITAVESGLILSETETNTLQVSDVESLSNFILASEWSLRLTINLRPDEEVLLAFQDIFLQSELQVLFFEQYQQNIPVQAKVQFPAVRVISGNIWFGTVLTTSVQTLFFSVINASYFSTEWHLIKEELEEEDPPPPEIPDPKKKASIKLAAAAAPIVEAPPAAEGSEAAVWKDPFKVYLQGGVLQGRGAREAVRQIVTVVFTPPMAKIYRQVFRIDVPKGRGCSLVMEGHGILEKPPQPTEEDLKMPRKSKIK